jgi:hypothetical protein
MKEVEKGTNAVDAATSVQEGLPPNPLYVLAMTEGDGVLPSFLPCFLIIPLSVVWYWNIPSNRVFGTEISL